METNKKPNAGNKPGVRHVEQTNESQNNNNVVKDTILFGSLFDQFNEHEIAFILTHLNRANLFGFTMNNDNLKFAEIAKIQEFLFNIKVGLFGQTFIDIINLKLSGQIKIQNNEDKSC